MRPIGSKAAASATRKSLKHRAAVHGAFSASGHRTRQRARRSPTPKLTPDAFGISVNRHRSAVNSVAVLDDQARWANVEAFPTHMSENRRARPGLAQSCALWRVEGQVAHPRNDRIATEEALEIRLNYRQRSDRVTQTVAITMRTPGNDRELATGFLFTEGIITSAQDIAEITSNDESATSTICVHVVDGVAIDLKPLQRTGTVTSACGVCGKTSADSLRRKSAFTIKSDAPRFDFSAIHRLPSVLRAAQVAFDQTGGLHAAALCDHQGDILALYEDVGRHNAVDKIIGAQLLCGGLPLANEILVVSGRASFELVQKAVMAGVPALAAVGAPSSFAVEVARASGTTLIGFMRDERFNVYAGAARLPELLRCNGAEKASILRR